MTELLEAENEAAALEFLHAERCTDGLPVIIPTVPRVDRMVLASGVDGDLSLGSMGPGGGAATIRAIAVNTVMAGCRPDDMPIVVAAITAMLQPEFDLGEMQGTTHSTAPLMIVNGPMRDACGVASGFGALGPGHRANASIGRAVRLCMINIGMARPGESDMALLGHGGKFTYCLAEDEESSPWEPLHTTFGYDAEESVVTIIGAEPPHSVVFQNDADDATSPARLLKSLGATLANLGSNNAHFRCGMQTVILNPEHATVLADAGMSRADVQAKLLEYSVNPHDRLAELNPIFVRPDDDGDIRAVRQAEDVVVLVAGGSGLYSHVLPSWAAGMHRNVAVHARIETDLACEIPGLTPNPLSSLSASGQGPSE